MMFGNTFLRFALATLVAGNAVLAASVAINSPDPAALVNAEPADKNTADFVSGANASDKQADTAHCGWSSWPHSCWKYIGAGPHWCWTQPNLYCDIDSDCDPNAACS